jgi:ketosteroid isomerase-like protein
MSRQPGIRQPLAIVLVTVTAVLAAATTLGAHDFWLVPNAFQLGAGDTLTVLGQTSSHFPTTESAVAVDRVADARVIGAGTETPIRDLSIADKSLRLRARPGAPGQYVVAARLHWRSSRESAESFRRYLQLEGAPAALERIDREGLLAGRDSVTRRYAKYARTLVQVGRGGGKAFSRAAGHPLEFIPVNDPGMLRPGDTLHVRLVLLGKPAANARVHAGAVEWTGGAPTSRDTVPAAADVELVSDAKGNIRIPITSGGLWNVRTIQIVQSPAGAAADWDAHWATFVFLVAAGSASRTSDSLDVVNAVNAYDRALRTGDSVAALALLAEDAVILESGGMETREEYRGHHLPADIEFAKAVPSESGPVSVKVRGDVAWAWSTSVTQGTFRGRQINSAGAELMVLTRTPSGWKISAIHWSSRARRQ